MSQAINPPEETHINAGLLNVAYAEVGPADGPVVILLHGWPYDIDSYAKVAPLLAAKGYRVLIPYARGYGDTRFLSDKTPRNGQPAALAYEFRLINGGIGHNLPQEAPQAFANADRL